MKKIFKPFSIFIVASLILTSCEDENDNTNASLINYSPATVTLSSLSNTAFDESAIDPDDESTYVVTITATLSSPQPVNAIIDLVQSGGTANSSDFEAGKITIPAGSLTASANVKILQTGDIEGSETLNITGKSRANFIVMPFTFSASIENDYINNVLEISTTWSGSYSYDTIVGDITADFCKTDLDVVLFNSAGNFVKYLGATADCTETGSISGLADGDYYLVIDVFDNPLSISGLSEPIPVTISYNQEHFVSGSFVSNSVNMASPVGLVAVATITISNGYNYTVTPL